MFHSQPGLDYFILESISDLFTWCPRYNTWVILQTIVSGYLLSLLPFSSSLYTKPGKFRSIIWLSGSDITNHFHPFLDFFVFHIDNKSFWTWPSLYSLHFFMLPSSSFYVSAIFPLAVFLYFNIYIYTYEEIMLYIYTHIYNIISLSPISSWVFGLFTLAVIL